MREGFRARLAETIALSALLAASLCLPGCGPTGPTGMGCDGDDDCPTGEFCGTGGCQAECRADRDCVRLGPGAVCTTRGRCEAGMDAGSDGGTSMGECRRVCDDGRYCNGIEQCEPTSSEADPDGCVTVPPGCLPGECDEATDRCDACRDPDDDDDGFDDVACPGGRDCDDSNPRIPSSMGEVCDPDGVDEDCNPITVGSRTLGDDEDGDGQFPTTCCNGSGDTARCGIDCSDDPTVDPQAAIRHGAQGEICNGVDDDCDERIDEGVSIVFYRDADCDRYGLQIPTPIREADGSLPPEVAPYARLGCDTTIGATTCAPGTPGWRRDNTDCNDADPRVSPFESEICDGARTDENCDGLRNEICDCTPGTREPCRGTPWGGGTATDTGLCQRGERVCSTGGRWGDCSGIDGTAEACSAGGGETADEDCDGRVDEGVRVSCGMRSWCSSTIPPEASIDGTCNYRDEDCDARFDEGLGFSCRQRWNWSSGDFASWNLQGSAVLILDASPRSYIDFNISGGSAAGAAWAGLPVDPVQRIVITGNIFVARLTSPPGDGVAVQLATATGVNPSAAGTLGVLTGDRRGWAFEADYYNQQVRIRRLSDNRVLGTAAGSLRAGDIPFRVEITAGSMYFCWGRDDGGSCHITAAGYSEVSGYDDSFGSYFVPGPQLNQLYLGLSAATGGARIGANVNYVELTREVLGGGFLGFTNCDLDLCGVRY